MNYLYVKELKDFNESRELRGPYVTNNIVPFV